MKVKEKEKAKEFVDNFLPHSKGNSNINEAKQCALIAVAEVIEELIETDFANRFSYWQEVKQEIINL